jgi:hypothetical protein
MRAEMTVDAPAYGVTRFPIRRDLLWRPLLVLFGATAGRSYVALAEDRLSARYGWLFHHSFPLSDIEGAARRSWPFFYGIGWRSNLIGLIGLIGSRAGVVEVRFKRRRWMWLLFPVSIDRLAFSLEDPEAFLEALDKAI